MATLVLTGLGQAIGGPVGGALGALAGQAIDGRLFRGAAREGPRLIPSFPGRSENMKV